MRTSLPFRRGRRAGAVAVAIGAAVAMVVAPAANADQQHHSDKQVIGYFTQWGIYSGFFEKNLVATGDLGHLTELDYAFSNISPDGVCASGDSWADYQRPFAATESVDGQADAAGQALM